MRKRTSKPAQDCASATPASIAARFQNTSRPLHELVRITLQERIGTGHYGTHVALPSVPSFSAEFGVSAITVKRALRDLKMAGLVRSVAGLGTFVRQRERFVQDLAGIDPVWWTP